MMIDVHAHLGNDRVFDGLELIVSCWARIKQIIAERS